MSFWASVLRGAGQKVSDRPVRAHAGQYGPVTGIMVHHTAGSAPGDLGVVRNGRAGLPGPLCQLYLSPSGVWDVVTEGKAYHAGAGSYSADGFTVPKDQGNTWLIGIEVSTPGTPIRGAQYAALIDGMAALCRVYGWGAERVIGHKEYAPRRKSDPANDMDVIRADVAARLNPALPWPLPWGRFYGHRAGLRGWARLRAVPSGPIVRRVNELLLGSSSSEFTANTASAVRSWQAKRALPITGWVDRRTARRMGVAR